MILKFNNNLPSDIHIVKRNDWKPIQILRASSSQHMFAFSLAINNNNRELTIHRWVCEWCDSNNNTQTLLNGMYDVRSISVEYYQDIVRAVPPRHAFSPLHMQVSSYQRKDLLSWCHIHEHKVNIICVIYLCRLWFISFAEVIV